MDPLKYPSQILSLAEAILFTERAEEAIKKGSLASYLKVSISSNSFFSQKARLFYNGNMFFIFLKRSSFIVIFNKLCWWNWLEGAQVSTRIVHLRRPWQWRRWRQSLGAETESSHFGKRIFLIPIKETEI